MSIKEVIKEHSAIYDIYKAYRKVFPKKFGIGIDLGVKDLAVCSNGKIYPSINKSKEIKDLKYKYNMAIINRNNREASKLLKQMDKLRYEYINDVVDDIVKSNPKYITIEDLHFNYTDKSCKSNSLHQAIRDQHFEYFKDRLIRVCRRKLINLRQVSNSYPSSKTCNSCGYINNNLTLADRVYICPRCHHKDSRDGNAAKNLRDCKEYKRLV